MDGYHQEEQCSNIPVADCRQEMLSSSSHGLCTSAFAFATDSEQDRHMRYFQAVNTEGTLLIMASMDEDKYV